jgi:hypothetical protein
LINNKEFFRTSAEASRFGGIYRNGCTYFLLVLIHFTRGAWLKKKKKKVNRDLLLVEYETQTTLGD